MLEIDFDANRIVLDSLDDINEYGNSVDLWVAMQDDHEKETVGNTSFGMYTLYSFDSPVEIVLQDGTLLDAFSAAILVEMPGKLADRETYALTYPSEQEARIQMEKVKDVYMDHWMAEEDKEEVTQELEV